MYEESIVKILTLITVCYTQRVGELISTISITRDALNSSGICQLGQQWSGGSLNRHQWNESLFDPIPSAMRLFTQSEFTDASPHERICSNARLFPVTCRLKFAFTILTRFSRHLYFLVEPRWIIFWPRCNIFSYLSKLLNSKGIYFFIFGGRGKVSF